MTELNYDTEDRAVAALHKYGHALFQQFPVINYLAVAPNQKGFEIKIGSTSGNPIKLKKYAVPLFQEFIHGFHSMASSEVILDELNTEIANQSIKTYKSGKFEKFLDDIDYINRDGELTKLEPSDRIHGGIHIGLSGRPAGTLGGIFQLEHEDLGDEFFGISNWHVLCQAHELGVDIFQPGFPYNENVDNLEDYICGKLCWYCFDDYREAAFVHFNKEAVDRIFRENACAVTLTGKTNHSMYNETVSVCGLLRSGEGNVGKLENDQIFSRHAMVRMSNSLFPNTQYGKNTMIFSDQILIDKLSDPGDSGSLLFNDQKEVLGLVFGQTDKTVYPQMSVANKIENIFGRTFDSHQEHCSELKVNGVVYELEKFKISTIY